MRRFLLYGLAAALLALPAIGSAGQLNDVHGAVDHGPSAVKALAATSHGEAVTLDRHATLDQSVRIIPLEKGAPLGQFASAEIAPGYVEPLGGELSLPARRQLRHPARRRLGRSAFSASRMTCVNWPEVRRVCNGERARRREPVA